MRLLLLLVAVAALACAPGRTTAVAGSGLVIAQTGRNTMLLDSSSGEFRGRLGRRQLGSASVLDGEILYTLGAHGIRALHLKSGAVGHPYHDEERWMHGSLLLEDGRLFATTGTRYGSSPDTVVAVSTAGELLWQRHLTVQRAELHRSQAPSLGAGLLLVPSGQELMAFSTTTGQLLWRFHTGAQVRWPTAGHARVYVLSDNAVLHAIEPTRGELVFSRQWFPGAPTRMRQLAANDETVLIGTGEHVVAFDAATGGVRYVVRGVEPLGMNATTALVWKQAKLLAIDAVSGSVRWQVLLHDALTQAPEITGDLVLLVQAEELRAHDLMTGVRRWKVKL